MTDYWSRLHAEEDFINAKKDYSFPHFYLDSIQYNNAAYKTYDHTYNIAISSGEKKVNFCERPEIFVEPKSSVKMSLGFDSDVI